MNKIAKSQDRGQFSKELYIKRLQNNPDDEHAKTMLDFLDNWGISTEQLEESDEWKVNNLEYDLRTSNVIVEKCKEEKYAQNLYAALCNNVFRKNDIIPILTEENWSCSWRSSGGIVADIREQGDYIDWYCSGIQHSDEIDISGFVPEGEVTDEIKEDLFNLGWLVIEDAR